MKRFWNSLVLLAVLPACARTPEPPAQAQPPVPQQSEDVTWNSQVRRPAYGRFEQPLVLYSRGCDASRDCKLRGPFVFNDGHRRWEAPQDEVTDGASIPNFAQPFVGGPYDGRYLAGAVIHDHYCKRHVRDFLSTHRAFYNALMALGLQESKSKAMYYAVMIGGPKWFELAEGEPCATPGQACVRNAGLSGLGISMERGSEETSGKMFFTRPARYGRADVKSDYQALLRELDSARSEISLDELDRRAAGRFPDDPFLQDRGRQTITFGALRAAALRNAPAAQ